MAYAGKKALVKVSGNPVAFTNEATTANADLTVYQITDTTKRVWDRTAPITVERSTDDGATWVTLDPETDGYKLSRLDGSVVFDAAQAAGTLIRVSGDYLPMSTAAECYEWSSNITGGTIDVTKFQAEWSEKIQGLKSAEGSLSRWWDIDTYFTDALISGNPIVIELYAQDDLEPDKIWAILTSDEMSAAVDGAVEDAVSFESTEKLLTN
jgi:hypothetical protein